MITKYTKETVADIKKEDNYYSEFYTINSLIADKLRVVYNLFGWSHMTGDFSSADDMVENTFNTCIEKVVETKDECEVTCAGFTIKMGFDEEETLHIDYYFKLD